MEEGEGALAQAAHPGWESTGEWAGLWATPHSMGCLLLGVGQGEEGAQASSWLLRRGSSWARHMVRAGQGHTEAADRRQRQQ